MTLVTIKIVHSFLELVGMLIKRSDTSALHWAEPCDGCNKYLKLVFGLGMLYSKISI